MPSIVEAMRSFCNILNIDEEKCDTYPLKYSGRKTAVTRSRVLYVGMSETLIFLSNNEVEEAANDINIWIIISVS